jgi:hypothetical protein
MLAAVRRGAAAAAATSARGAAPRRHASFLEALGLSAKPAAPPKAEELFADVRALYETVLSPLNARWMGPLEKSGAELCPLPIVLILGNHSSGKSSFINYVTGRRVQDTGVAPTDDGFTLIVRGTADEDQSGPAVVGTPRWALAGCASSAACSSTTWRSRCAATSSLKSASSWTRRA